MAVFGSFTKSTSTYLRRKRYAPIVDARTAISVPHPSVCMTVVTTVSTLFNGYGGVVVSPGRRALVVGSPCAVDGLLVVDLGVFLPLLVVVDFFVLATLA